VVYEPGELKVVAYKQGKQWATDTTKTTGPAQKLTMQPDRAKIQAGGSDLSYVTVTVTDKNGLQVPRAKNHLRFSVEGPGEIVATDNGDATSLVSFQSPERDAFNGLALVIVRARPGQSGEIILKGKADGLAACETKITAVAKK
jgi:beta-galactosidase